MRSKIVSLEMFDCRFPMYCQIPSHGRIHNAVQFESDANSFVNL